MAKRLAIIASKGTLDMAYPPLILASTAAALDMECGIFFTFYGLDIINKKKYANLKVAPIANPAMPVSVPNIVGMLPGMTSMATKMMNGMIKKANVPSIPEFIDVCLESGVKMWPCQLTLDMMGIKPEDLIEGIDASVGAAHFIDYAADADMSLFI
ncbi:MAG: DsrE/DsrF/DrsH-like family protein [Actinomycetota bacterium]|jgi:peroxiredoxin family protein|nr:DsrE/DsrF/DrsH-like family protein [Actinomycetota bacterium]MCL6092305.1 DsrE/DsrF/DrsH-like family protein [Actinomycetota bacterium]MDA8166459.1 DsrE/DsrF/DrsH-like family protein [Actinomycetota bacterium]